MEKKNNNYGGTRAGAGRPKGSSNKIKFEDLMYHIELKTGLTFAEQLADNYAAAIVREDWTKVENYDRAFLNKIVADKQEVTEIKSEDAVQARAEAFAEALATLATAATKTTK